MGETCLTSGLFSLQLLHSSYVVVSFAFTIVDIAFFYLDALDWLAMRHFPFLHEVVVSQRPPFFLLLFRQQQLVVELV